MNKGFMKINIKELKEGNIYTITDLDDILKSHIFIYKNSAYCYFYDVSEGKVREYVRKWSHMPQEETVYLITKKYMLESVNKVFKRMNV